MEYFMKFFLSCKKLPLSGPWGPAAGIFEKYP